MFRVSRLPAFLPSCPDDQFLQCFRGCHLLSFSITVGVALILCPPRLDFHNRMGAPFHESLRQRETFG